METSIWNLVTADQVAEGMTLGIKEKRKRNRALEKMRRFKFNRRHFRNRHKVNARKSRAGIWHIRKS